MIPKQPGQAPITQSNRIPTIPNLLLRETVVAISLVAVLMVLAFLAIPYLKYDSDTGGVWVRVSNWPKDRPSGCGYRVNYNTTVDSDK